MKIEVHLLKSNAVNIVYTIQQCNKNIPNICVNIATKSEALEI